MQGIKSDRWRRRTRVVILGHRSDGRICVDLSSHPDRAGAKTPGGLGARGAQKFTRADPTAAVKRSEENLMNKLVRSNRGKLRGVGPDYGKLPGTTVDWITPGRGRDPSCKIGKFSFLFGPTRQARSIPKRVEYRAAYFSRSLVEIIHQDFWKPEVRSVDWTLVVAYAKLGFGC